MIEFIAIHVKEDKEGSTHITVLDYLVPRDFFLTEINSLRPSDAYMRQWTNHHCGSDNGLSPGRRQAIIWTNAGILLIGPLGTNINEI